MDVLNADSNVHLNVKYVLKGFALNVNLDTN